MPEVSTLLCARDIRPLRDSESDWCHFVERLDRSRIQKHLIKGVLGYEDEKYSYLLMSKYPIHSDGKRIISRPNITKYSVSFDVCSEKNGHIVVKKRENKNKYQIAKKSIRGDLYSSQNSFRRKSKYTLNVEDKT